MPPTSDNRITSFDGLRGVASVVVLIHHCFATVPALGVAYLGQPRTVVPELRWLTYTPLHLVWAGQEAVYVFFVLSGLVLTLPALRRRYEWRSYYPSRLVRLYLPVFGSLVLAVMILTIVPRALTLGHGRWMEQTLVEPTVGGLLRDLTLVRPDLVNGPLWSLRWEVVFSVLLPLYLWIGKRFTRAPWLLIALGAGVATAGTLTSHVWITFLPMFLVGVALAFVVRDGEVSLHHHRWRLLAGFALLGLTSDWWLRGAGQYAHSFSLPIIILSAVVLVMSAVRWGGFRRALDGRLPRWLGARSFSLYLVHYPLVIAVASLVPSSAPWLTFLIAIPLSVAAAAGFFLAVESPAHRLATQISQSRRFDPARNGAGV